MRNMFLFLMLSLTILTSCEEESVGGGVIDVYIPVVLTDANLNDLLNPDSSGYLGDEYVKGIEFYCEYKGQRITYQDHWKINPGSGMESHEYGKVFPPYREVEGYGKISEGMLGYYFINATPFTLGTQMENIAYSYICYPDGSEDELKVIFYKQDHLLIDQIFLNGKMIYSMTPMEGSVSKEQYYDPEHYPFLKPYVDDNGQQIGNLQQPVEEAFIVIRK